MSKHIRITEKETRRLWERAAQLQAEAVDHRERPGAPGPVGGDAAEGYPLEHVRQAAAEAGIAPEFFDRALAESLDGPVPRPIVVTHRFDRSATEVYEAVRSVFPRLGISLVDSQGKHPLEGGTLAFEFSAASTDASLATLRSSIFARELQLRIQPAADGHCEVTLSALPRTPAAVKMTVWAAWGCATVVGWWVVGALSAAIAALAGLSGAANAATVGAGMLIGAGLGAGLGRKWMLSLRRRGISRATDALDRLLRKLGVELKVGRAFEAPER